MAEKSKKSGTKKEKEKEKEKTAAEKFVQDVLIRGEAARPDEHGDLPPGATHEIVEECEGEPPKIKRRRFSIT
jgi:hypothetical protein